MISHITLGTNHLASAVTFYSALLALVKGKPIYHSDKVVFFEFEGRETKLAITTPYNQENATVGNGTMLALKADNIELVDKAYAIAMELGGLCEGAPGYRNDKSFYGAYIRDLDGNKIALFYR